MVTSHDRACGDKVEAVGSAVGQNPGHCRDSEFAVLEVHVARRADPAAVLESFVVAAACAYYAGCQLLASFRWQLILRAKRFHISLGRLFRFYLIGTFFNAFLPTGLGGDVVKTFYLYRETKDGEESMIAVFSGSFHGTPRAGSGVVDRPAVLRQRDGSAARHGGRGCFLGRIGGSRPLRPGCCPDRRG